MKYSKLLSLLVVSMLLVGCLSKNKVDIDFTDKTEYEVGTEIDYCSLIDTVDNSKDFEVKGEKVILNDDTEILCNYNSVSADKVGRYNIGFRYFEQIYTLDINIVDTTEPVIKSSDVYEVEVGNEYFDLKTLIKVNDESDYELFINGNYDIDKIGNYDIDILAKDQYGNESKKSVKVEVKDKENIIIENDYTQSTNSSNNSNTTGGNPPPVNNNNTAVPSNPVPQAPSFKPSNKKFSIDNYNNFTETHNACVQYRDEQFNKGYVGSASCENIVENGIGKGHMAVFE